MMVMVVTYQSLITFIKKLTGKGFLANVIGQFKTNKTSLDLRLVHLIVAESKAGRAPWSAYFFICP